MAEEPSYENKAAKATIPDTMRGLRACLKCKLIKSIKQFQDEGCENCAGSFDNANANQFTTPTFHGQALTS